MRNTQPSLGCSSEASPQSLSPSQTYDITIHLEVFAHLNSVGSQVRSLQAWSPVASSEPSPQSSSPSHTNFVVMQRPGETKQNNNACTLRELQFVPFIFFCGLAQSHKQKTAGLSFWVLFFLAGRTRSWYLKRSVFISSVSCLSFWLFQHEFWCENLLGRAREGTLSRNGSKRRLVIIEVYNCDD